MAARNMTPSVAIQCRRYIVRGKVQGVFFRASARDVAQELGITGHAVNLPDGTVEVLACGSAGALNSMGQWLRRGPAMAKVVALDEKSEDIAPPHGFTTA
jgi:acylphosphatase